MTNWFNPRVAAVAISILVLVVVSKVGEPHRTIRIDCIACLLLYLLYAVVFLVPLWRSFGFRSIIGPAFLLTLAWIAVIAALVSDALPVPLDVQMARRINLPMTLFCVAGAVGFFLFFQSMVTAFERRDEVLEARGRRAD